MNELTKRQEILKQRLDKLYDDKLDEKITESFYQKKYEEYASELKGLEKTLSKVNNASLSYFELSLNFYDLSQRSTEIYSKASIEQKRSLIKVVFDSLTVDNGVLEWNYSKPFKMLYDAVQTTNSSKLLKDKVNDVKIFEPEEKRLLLKMTLQNLRLDGKIVRYDWKKPFDKIALYASRPSWLPLHDSNYQLLKHLHVQLQLTSSPSNPSFQQTKAYKLVSKKIGTPQRILRRPEYRNYDGNR
jgi:hypothetical protein